MEPPALHVITSYLHVGISQDRTPGDTEVHNHCPQSSHAVASLAFCRESSHFFVEATSRSVIDKDSTFARLLFIYLFKAACDHSPSSCSGFCLTFSSHQAGSGATASEQEPRVHQTVGWKRPERPLPALHWDYMREYYISTHCVFLNTHHFFSL